MSNKLLKIIAIWIFILLFSCSKIDTSIIKFDGKTFELPIRVGVANELFDLQYKDYIGFYKSKNEKHIIVTQLQNEPVFLGTDVFFEEIYYNDYFVGITFYKYNKNFQQLKNEIEKQQNQIFIKKVRFFEEIRYRKSFNMEYYYLKTNEGLIVALKELLNKSNTKKYITVSFYKGIDENRLERYLEHIN